MFGYGPIAGTDGWGLMVDAPESDFMQDSYHVIKILLAGDFSKKLAESVNSIKATLTGLMRQIQDMADSVGIGSSELADASNLLSEGTMVQATSIQRVVEEIENIAEGIRSNSQNEALVNTRLQSLDDQIKKSNQEMTQLMSISDVVQTNTATAEETAASTGILSSQADNLRDIVNQFKLHKER